MKKIKHSLSFITLTIPGKERKVEAEEGNKNLLAPFVRIMRQKRNMITYIWKAEFQKNDQLHYHITTPSVIHYQYIKDTWNNLLSSRGLLTEWIKEHPNGFPNSTDIHSVYKKKDISWYLSKEISKTQQDKATKGKIWDCSLNIKGRKFFSTIEPSSLAGILDPKNLIKTESCEIYKLSDPWKILQSDVKQQYNNWRLEIIDKGLY